jgi:DNA-binding transcriptional regulator PaaX
MKNNTKKRLNNRSADILYGLLIGGVLIVGALSPLTLSAFAAAFVATHKYNKKSFTDAFYYLNRKKYITIEHKNGEKHVNLTSIGKQKANRYALRKLIVKKPQKWDTKWRIVIFDISSKKTSVRNALRDTLKRLEFYQLQKSVWISPYPCIEEIQFIKSFFDLTDTEIRIITSIDISDDKDIKKFFRL